MKDNATLIVLNALFTVDARKLRTDSDAWRTIRVYYYLENNGVFSMAYFKEVSILVVEPESSDGEDWIISERANLLRISLQRTNKNVRNRILPERWVVLLSNRTRAVRAQEICTLQMIRSSFSKIRGCENYRLKCNPCRIRRIWFSRVEESDWQKLWKLYMNNNAWRWLIS